MSLTSSTPNPSKDDSPERVLGDIPSIQLVPLDKLILHENHDMQRVTPLIERLRASGILRNPPIVTPFHDEGNRYMVLDGANRTTAFKEMGFPHILAQVIEPDSPNLSMKTWNHVLWNQASDIFLDNLRSIEGLNVQHIKDGHKKQQKLLNNQGLVWIQTPDEQEYQVTTQSNDLAGRVEKLNNVMNSYKKEAMLDRTSVRQITALMELYQGMTALVIFPPFQIKEILELCLQGHLFPAGVTRFIVAPRVLRVNYPLAEIASDRPLDEKKKALKLWLQERIAGKRVRYYSEPTVLFDE